MMMAEVTCKYIPECACILQPLPVEFDLLDEIEAEDRRASSIKWSGEQMDYYEENMYFKEVHNDRKPH